MTIRDRITAIQRDVRDGDPSPAVLRAHALELVGLLGNVNAEVTEAELAYAGVLLAAYRTEAAASRAKLAAETTPEYARVRVAKDTQRLAVEMLRVIKAVLRSTEEEMRLGTH